MEAPVALAFSRSIVRHSSSTSSYMDSCLTRQLPFQQRDRKLLAAYDDDDEEEEEEGVTFGLAQTPVAASSSALLRETSSSVVVVPSTWAAAILRLRLAVSLRANSLAFLYVHCPKGSHPGRKPCCAMTESRRA
eukprot:scaffold5326_cov191-Amphora_coffeaeformis.AAC.4